MTIHFPTFRRWDGSLARVPAQARAWSRAVLDRPRGSVTLGWKQWLALVALLAGVLVLISIVIPDNPIRVWYWMNIVGPEQEVRFGFKARIDERARYCMEISHIVPGGAFAQAGVRQGWVPVGLSRLGFHVSELFFAALREAKDGSVLSLTFSPRGCAGIYERPVERRRVRVIVPKGAA